MKLFFNNIQNIIIVVLVVIIILMQQCSNASFDFSLFPKKDKPPVEGTVITKIETKWDTLTLDSLVYVPKWNTKIEYRTEYETIMQDIDTVSILKDYYSKYVYSDTVSLDSFGNIVINDTITENKIVFRKIKPNIYIPTTTITRDSLISKNEFYYGFGLAGNQEQFNYIGGELLFRSKKKKVLGVGVGLNNQLQPIISARMMWKIGK
jgi:hypothetical protein